MFFTESKIQIHAPLEKVYFLIKDVKKWPEIFKPCQDIKILDEQKDQVKIQVTAYSGGKLLTWKSIRIYDDANHRVYFEQFEPAPPLSCMSGEWICKKNGDATEVIFTHRFDFRIKFLKSLLAFIAKRFFINTNSIQELQGLKKYAEEKQHEI